jgi:hypothetical protein
MVKIRRYKLAGGWRQIPKGSTYSVYLSALLKFQSLGINFSNTWYEATYTCTLNELVWNNLKIRNLSIAVCNRTVKNEVWWGKSIDQRHRFRFYLHRKNILFRCSSTRDNFGKMNKLKRQPHCKDPRLLGESSLHETHCWRIRLQEKLVSFDAWLVGL